MGYLISLEYSLGPLPGSKSHQDDMTILVGNPELDRDLPWHPGWRIDPKSNTI